MNRLWVRLSLAFSLVIVAGVAIVILTPALAFQFGERQLPPSPRRLRDPGGLVEQLSTHYRVHHQWDGVEDILAGPFPGHAPILVRVSVVGEDGQVTRYGRFADPKVTWWETTPIEVDEQTVGYLEMVPAPRDGRPPDEGRDRILLTWLTRTLSLTAVAGGVVAIVAGVLMSRNLTAPLNELAEAARAIGARNLSRRVRVSGSDEIVELGQAFNEMAAQLEQAEALRRNLMADVAHELRTPLSVLQGNLQAILDDVYSLDKAEVASLYDQTRLLSRLVNDLHELTLAEAGQLPMDVQSTNPANLISTTVNTFNPVAEAKGVTVSTQLPDGLPVVLVDPVRLTQVLHNLLTNALRHTSGGDSISVQASHDEASIQLVVQDTGEGIPPEHLPYVFDRFYRADPARSRTLGGAGLGLAIARAIVEAHGGQISAASEGVPGHGSTFTIRLPLLSPFDLSRPAGSARDVAKLERCDAGADPLP